MRRLGILAILILLAGCAGATRDATGTAALAPRPTATLSGDSTAAPAPSPAATAPLGEATIVFQQPFDGSIQAFSPAGDLLILADPTTPGQRMPWQISPDGQTIAVVIVQGGDFKTGAYESASLWTVRVDGSEPRKLLDMGGNSGAPIETSDRGAAIANEQNQRLAWTPDGRWIVLDSARGGQVDLYAVAADAQAGSGAIRQLTNTPEIEFDLAISPDGQSIAYATTTSFGTGGGLGEPAVWSRPLYGEARPLFRNDPQAPAAGVAVIGWLDNATVLAISSSQTGSTIWVRQGDGEPRALQDVAIGGAWDLQPGRLAFTDPVAGNPKAAGALFLWQGGAADPANISDAASQAHLDPHSDAMLVCESDTPQAGFNRGLWRGGEVIALGFGPCGNLAWSERGHLALGGDAEHDINGLIVGPAGGVLDTILPADAELVGWLGATLYFFAPTGGGFWQLYGLDAARQGGPVAIGELLAGQPAGPRLLIPR